MNDQVKKNIYSDRNYFRPRKVLLSLLKKKTVRHTSENINKDTILIIKKNPEWLSNAYTLGMKQMQN